MDKKTLCLYFQVHQPIRLRKYHFFDIGKNSDYYDDFANRTITRKVADRCYLPANRTMLELIRKYGKNFKVSFSISGMVIEQFREYALRHKDWVDKGYVPNDSMTSGILANEYIASGTVFGMTTNYSPLEAPTQQANYTFPIGMAEITKPVNSTSGLQERMWGIPVTCENPEKAMAFLNLMFANAEVANLLSNGIEGLNYQFSGEGIVTYADGVDPAAPGYARIFSRFGDQMKVYQWEPATPEIYEELAAFNENAMNSLTLGYSFNSENVATEVAAVTTVITQYLPALECGMVDDVDAAIATLNEELEKAGLSRIIEENQRQLNEWMANQ